jgi:hypothetical protein
MPFWRFAKAVKLAASNKADKAVRRQDRQHIDHLCEIDHLCDIAMAA